MEGLFIDKIGILVFTVFSSLIFIMYKVTEKGPVYEQSNLYFLHKETEGAPIAVGDLSLDTARIVCKNCMEVISKDSQIAQPGVSVPKCAEENCEVKKHIRGFEE